MDRNASSQDPVSMTRNRANFVFERRERDGNTNWNWHVREVCWEVLVVRNAPRSERNVRRTSGSSRMCSIGPRVGHDADDVSVITKKR